MAITYDELCRKHWSQKAARGDRDFDINTVSFVKDKDLLERARALFDASAKGSHLCMPLSCTLMPVCICKAKQQSLQPRRRAQSQLQPNSWETLVVRCRRLFAVLLSRAFFPFVLQLARNLAKGRGPRVTASPKVITVVHRGARKVMVAAGEIERRKVGGWISRVSRRKHPLISTVWKYLHLARPCTLQSASHVAWHCAFMFQTTSRIACCLSWQVLEKPIRAND